MASETKMILKILVSLFVVVTFANLALSVAIHRDSDVLKKSQRGGKQLNDLPFYDDYPVASSRWESAEWPREFRREREDNDDSYGSEERPYDSFYYTKYLTNGRLNHLYNGPQNDPMAGIGEPGNNPPQILPKPVPSVRRLNRNGK
ncbi:hypothetical protein Ocin01_13491 [Orchesella cincta]|uniref:Uncharacterized protein n=1 Tax=Orchesella cincta TaxID=48709 RepID=A0A1D2MJT2_ORCCI|nr:hypothetical protein Ocin01_13491 [Orchesella cincta]